MQPEELAKIKESLSKSLASAQESRTIDLLQRLKAFKASTDSLKSTRIGVYVTELRKHANATDRVKELSKELIAKWKSDIGQPGQPAQPAQSTTSSTASSRNGSISSPAGVSLAAARAASAAANGGKGLPTELRRRDSDGVSVPGTPTTPTGPPAMERTVSSDNVNLKSLGDKVREKCASLLYSALATGTSAPGSMIAKLVAVIEQTVHKENPTPDKYKSRIRSLVSNLKDKSNTELRESIVSGDIRPEHFAVMTTEEMMSKNRKAEVDQAFKSIMHDAVSAPESQAETDMFKCGKCHQRKTRYYQMQTRSADEPMTTFVTCVNCGNKWKFC
ncbi:transcription factor S-II, central domain-containing protein [Entophlyctis helioformis]|nr:transcription factor S-II, central domain-containing protein [Entophlyctis helioformis]